MNDRNEFEKGRDNNLVDIDFSANSEMQRIREDERIEREKRRKHAARLRRAEMIRRKKIERIKKMILAWSVLLLCVIAVVALVVGVISLFKGDKTDDTEGQTVVVSEAENTLVSEFSDFDGKIFDKDNSEEQYAPAAMNKMFSDVVTASFIPSLVSPVNGSHLSMIADAFLWNADGAEREKIKQVIRDYPVYSNGYVWSVESSMKNPVVNSYLYDTNAAFISAVCEICFWEGSAAFLESVDMTGAANRDISLGMTVGEKLSKAVSHYFDSLGEGGIRYNENDGLVYVLTSDNNGTDAGKPSNLFYNFRFGYIDAYNNMVFNAAMQDLVSLYTLIGDKENAEKYEKIAKQNKAAINEKLYDSELGRCVGCIDKEGEKHDYGFTVVNLMAVSFGIADDAKAESILSWVEGDKNIKSDTYSNPNNFSSLVTPAFSTVKADKEWWFNAEGNFSVEDEAAFGKYWMNGAPSALAGNYYLLSAEDTADCVYALVNQFNEGAFAASSSDKAEPSLYYALFAGNAVKKAFGVDTDGKNLLINPVFKNEENAGIKNIAFSSNNYSVLVHKDVVYVMAEENAAVRLKIGGFEKNEMLLLTTVENGSVVSSESVSADKSGVLSVSRKFGKDSYIKIEKDNSSKGKE